MNRPSLEDRAEIEDLYARYMWALDTGDSEGYAACFTPDALVFEVQPDGSVTSGRALAFVEEGYHQDPHFVGHQHRHDNLVYAPDPEGPPTTGRSARTSSRPSRSATRRVPPSTRRRP